MPDPVSRAGSKPLPTFNEALSTASQRTFAEPIPVNSEPAVERVPEQDKKGAIRAGKWAATHALEHGGVHLLKHHPKLVGQATARFVGVPGLTSTISKLAAGAAPGASLIVTGMLVRELSSVMFGAPTVSDDQKARVQNQFRQAATVMARDVLPAGYVKERITDEPAALARLKDTQESLGVRLKSEEQAELTMRRFQQELKSSATQGMSEAAIRNIRTTGELEKVLGKDAALRQRYHEDLGFQEGIKAGIWQAQHEPSEFEARRSMVASQQRSR
ncbi:MAG: hypothetical protein MUF64_05545 [Polyangiaceae bacterium]|jgi:hypothetical protein|nr:hypothetical protein [Polyangiaceae bacterium]